VFPVKPNRTGINFDDYDKIPVDVSGEGLENFQKVDRFSETRMAEELFENVRRCGYERPTPIQKFAIPIVIGGRDLMACAQTGSGKTAAFLLPAFQSLINKGPPPAPPSNASFGGSGGGYGKRGATVTRRTPMPIVLVLAPTRELCAQIYEE